MRRIGPLGPTQEGFDNLLQWLIKWTDIYERYGTLFVQWTNVDLPGSAVRGLVSNFLRSYNLRIASRFRRSGLAGLNPREAAIVTTSVIHRFNYLRFVSHPDQPTADETVRDLAVALQMMLFPTTPVELLETGSPPRQCHHVEPAKSKSVRGKRESKLDGLTPRSAVTVDRILEAGAQCIAASGYHRANVDDIVKQAGFARGTFYKYFNEKLDLLLALSDRCEVDMRERIAAFSKIDPGVEGATARRVWLADFLEFRSLYVGVLRTWIDRSPTHPVLDAASARVTQMVHECLAQLLEHSRLQGVVSVRAAEVMLIGGLERLPDALADNARPIPRRQVVELTARVIERALFGLDIEDAATALPA
jgi:AcrR family transcriptional regulator